VYESVVRTVWVLNQPLQPFIGCCGSSFACK
jgi:hypothetical protein